MECLHHLQYDALVWLFKAHTTIYNFVGERSIQHHTFGHIPKKAPALLDYATFAVIPEPDLDYGLLKQGLHEVNHPMGISLLLESSGESESEESGSDEKENRTPEEIILAELQVFSEYENFSAHVGHLSCMNRLHVGHFAFM